MKKFLSLLSIVATLCLGIGMTACGNNGDGDKKEITLTQSTDFTALVSEKVDADGWKKAFDFNNYDKSFTSSLKVTKGEWVNYIFKHTRNETYYSTFPSTDAEFHFECSSKFENNTYSYYYYTDEEEMKEDYPEGGFIQQTKAGDSEYSYYKQLHDSYMDMRMFCANFSNRKCSLSAFTYDESKHSYVCSAAEGTTYFEDFSENGEYLNNFTDIEIKIINGRLAYLSANSEEDGNIVQCFYDFGTTSIEWKNVPVLDNILE